MCIYSYSQFPLVKGTVFIEYINDTFKFNFFFILLHVNQYDIKKCYTV